MLKHAQGTIRGKTLVHKRAYFLNFLCNLGLEYIPHYYGPFSPELEAAIGRGRALGFVREETVDYGPHRQLGFEVRRFDCALTDDGHVVVEDLVKRKPEECRKALACLDELARAGDDSYVALSIAAKTHHILRTVGQPLTRTQIVAQASKLNWQVSEEDINGAVEFLKRLELVKVDKT